MEVPPAVAALVALGAAGGFAIAPARADPDDIVRRPLVLPQGSVELRLTAAINVQVRSVGEPLSLAPDAWWGVSPRLTVGLIHSDASLDQIATTGSFCVRRSAITLCDRLYHGSGVDVRYGVLDGDLALAPRLRVLVRALDPFKPAITVGGTLRWRRGRFAITTDPYLRLPLANHELGNASEIMLPLWLAVQPARGWLIALRGGFDADLVVIRDGGHGSFGVDVVARVTDDIDLGLTAGWASLFGPQHDGRHGTVMIGATWRR